jgi:hypothetical protein
MSEPDWMELAEEPGEQPTQLIRPTPSNLARKPLPKTYVEAEEKLYVEATAILSDTFSSRDIVPGQQEPPEEWIEAMGKEEAEKRLRVANAGWLPQKDAPAFVTTARAFAVGRMKSEATKKSGNRTLNVQYVTMAAPPEVYEEIEVTRDK